MVIDVSERVRMTNGVMYAMLAGFAAVAAMTATDKLEQWLSGRLSSLEGIVLGAVRGCMAERGLRGSVASFLFMNFRLIKDQTLENVTGAGSLPWTWPVYQQWIDLLHKGVYAFVTGLAADPLLAMKGQAPVDHLLWGTHYDAH
jgi:hypothetical protein